MSEELTQREHDDLRYVVLLGTQQDVRSARRRQWLALAIALFVGGALGAVATAGYSMREPVNTPPSCGVSIAANCEPRPTPSATSHAPESDANPLPPLEIPAIGAHRTLPPDPRLTPAHLFGALERAEQQGIDSATLQGFQRVGKFEPWVADTHEGHMACISIRTSDGSLLDPMECEPFGMMPSIEMPYEGSTLRFVYTGGGVDVYVVEP